MKPSDQKRLAKVKLPRTTKLVLMMIAQFSDDEGTCWLTSRQLAVRCSIHYRTLRRAAQTAKMAGYIVINKQKNRFKGDAPNTYLVCPLPVISCPKEHYTPIQGRTECPTGGGTDCPTHVQDSVDVRRTDSVRKDDRQASSFPSQANTNSNDHQEARPSGEVSQPDEPIGESLDVEERKLLGTGALLSAEKMEELYQVSPFLWEIALTPPPFVEDSVSRLRELVCMLRRHPIFKLVSPGDELVDGSAEYAILEVLNNIQDGVDSGKYTWERGIPGLIWGKLDDVLALGCKKSAIVCTEAVPF